MAHVEEADEEGVVVATETHAPHRRDDGTDEANEADHHAWIATCPEAVDEAETSHHGVDVHLHTAADRLRGRALHQDVGGDATRLRTSVTKQITRVGEHAHHHLGDTAARHHNRTTTVRRHLGADVAPHHGRDRRLANVKAESVLAI